MLEMLDALAAMPTWLIDLVDGTKVRAALESILPEARSGEVAILGCEPGRLRLKKEGWSGGYLVTVQHANDPEPRRVQLRGSLLSRDAQALPSQPTAFGDAEWRATLPAMRLLLQTEPADADLPSLPILTDPEAARDLLEKAIGGAAPAYDGYRLHSCDPRILRHKPGSRCTIRYALGYDEPSVAKEWPGVVIAKAYRGEKGRVAWEGMTALWRSPMRSSGVALAEPLAYLTELGALVQGAVPGDRTLRDALRSAVSAGAARDLDTVRVTVRATAAGLAALHRSGIRPGSVVTWQDELTETRGMMDAIAAFAPDVNSVGTPLLERLAEMAQSVPSDPDVPAHGSFRPDQVLLHGDRIGFVDFDGFCQAEPALDIALFRTTVRRLGSQPGHRFLLAGLADDFLSEYSRHAEVSPVRIALWEALELFTGVLHGWTKIKPEKARAALAALEAHLSSGWLTT